MNDRLVTIASFATPVEARLAMNRLQDAGVRATLEAENTSGMAWHLTNAIGGVKLLVMERDADRAISILEAADDGVEVVASESSADPSDVSAHDPDDDSQAADELGDDWPADDEDQSDKDFDDDDADDSDYDVAAGIDDTSFDEADETLTRREETADRAIRGAVVGLLFWPLQIYVFWLLLKVFVSDERLHPAKRKRAIIAAVICIPFLLAWCVFMRTLAMN